jgi:hypothetical protein
VSLIRLSAISALAAVLAVSSSICQAQDYPKPNLSETNLREPPKSNPNAGAPADYLLISPNEKDHYLRFDIPVAEIKVDDPKVIVAAPNRNDPMTIDLQPQGTGRTRVLVFGRLEGVGVADLRRIGSGDELVPKLRLLYDALVAVGTRVVTMRDKGVREIMDCAPDCYPSPTPKPREPDQIIEQRNR